MWNGAGDLCAGAGAGNTGCSGISGGRVDAVGCIFAGGMRHCLFEKIRRNRMNIVVWKAPKALRGILRRIFGLNE